MQEAYDASGEPQPRKILPSSRIFEALHAIAVAVGGLHDPAHLAQMAGERARELVGGDAVGVHLWNDASAVLEPLYATDPLFSGPFLPVLAGQGVAGQAFQQAKPIIVTDYPNWAHALPWAREYGVQQVVAVPLVVAERTIGTLVVRFLSARNCTLEQAEILLLVAAQIAPALQVAVLRTRSERERAWLAAVIEHLPVGVVVLDVAGQVIALNTEGRRLGGAALDRSRPLAEQAADYQIRTDRTGQNLAPEDTAAARALRGERVPPTDYLVRPPGAAEDLWTRVSAVPIRDEQAQLIGAVAIFSDITRERRLLEAVSTRAVNNAWLARELADREQQLQDELHAILPAGLSVRSQPPTMSTRERQVLGLIARGNTNRQIGEVLEISPGTVRKHVERILAKLNVVDRTQAAVRASELKIIEPQQPQGD